MIARSLLCAGIFALSLSARAAESCPIRLMFPAEGASVPVLTDAQKAFFDSPDELRRGCAGDAAYRSSLLEIGWLPRPVAFVWDGIKTRKCQVRFRIWREGDGVCVCDTNLAFHAMSRFVWDNFRVGTAYRWSVAAKGKGEATGRFVTADQPPRLLRAEGVHNLRDLGGWRTRDGRRVRQGLLFRSANLCENSCECAERPPRLRVTAADCHFLTNSLGIRTELDLRGPKECEGLSSSPLGLSVRRVEISSGCYGEMSRQSAKDACLRELRLIADGRNLPLLFHCSSGQDRTGTLAFIVNGLLGVPPEDLARDWDATMLWNNEHDWFNRNVSYAALLKVIEDYPGLTLNDRIASYVKSIGFTDEEIARLRGMLLE